MFERLGMDAGVWAKKCFVELDRKRITAGQIQATEAAKFARQHRALAAAAGREGEGRPCTWQEGMNRDKRRTGES